MSHHDTDEFCPDCQKPSHLCVCEAVNPVDTRLKLLLLQHPQEKREVLGTAVLVTRVFPNVTMRVGLSWPGLRRLVGEHADAKRWGVLYLGAAQQGGGKAGGKPGAKPAPSRRAEVEAVDAKGVVLRDSADVLADLEGIVVLDGTWSQAKTLWWRNAWLLKCRRIVLNPDVRSLYGAARKEPRRESLSTLESVAYLISRLEGRPELYEQALTPFALLLKKLRAPRKRVAPVPASPDGATPDGATPEGAAPDAVSEQLDRQEAADDGDGHHGGDQG